MILAKPGVIFQVIVLALLVVGGTMDSALIIYPKFIIYLFLGLYGISIASIIGSKLLGSEAETKGSFDDIVIFIGALVIFGFLNNDLRSEGITEITIAVIVENILIGGWFSSIIQSIILLLAMFFPFYSVIKHGLGNYKVLRDSPKLPPTIKGWFDSMEGKMKVYKTIALSHLPYSNRQNDGL